MTVNQMILLSQVLLGTMVFFFLAAVIVFYVLDVRKAWKILTGKKIPISKRKENKIRDIYRTTQKINTNDLLKEEMRTSKLANSSVNITELLKTQESIFNQYKGYDVTTVLQDNGGETTVLISQNEKDTKENIVMDITFIHTEITL